MFPLLARSSCFKPLSLRKLTILAPSGRFLPSPITLPMLVSPTDVPTIHFATGAVPADRGYIVGNYVEIAAPPSEITGRMQFIAINNRIPASWRLMTGNYRQ